MFSLDREAPAEPFVDPQIAQIFADWIHPVCF
jgi:hypothetical protein